MDKKVGDWYQYSGVVHIHTTESDGTKPLREVVALGQEVGLDFMMFTDHMDLSNQEAGREGIYGNTLVVIGYEHNDFDDNNHLLVFNSPRVYPHDMSALEYVAAARNDGAFSIIAHPIETRSREGKYPPYPWLEWSTGAFHGIEIWNQMSEWMEKLTPLNKLVMVFSPRKSMVGPPEPTLKLWDSYNLKGKYVGVAGADAHAFPVDVGPLKVEIFPYKVHFRALRTHVILPEKLSEDFHTARQQLFEALADCRVFNSNVRWGNASRFRFYAQSAAGQFVSGQEVPDHKDVTIRIELPSRATIKLIRNGAGILQTKSDRLEYKLSEPGLYRVEAWKGRRGWIFSNHIRVNMSNETGV